MKNTLAAVFSIIASFGFLASLAFAMNANVKENGANTLIAPPSITAAPPMRDFSKVDLNPLPSPATKAAPKPASIAARPSPIKVKLSYQCGQWEPSLVGGEFKRCEWR